VVDRDTGAPIAGALVVEEWRTGATVPTDAPPVAHARFATSDAAGRFRFEAESSGLRCAARERRSYAFAHPDYGLVRAGEAEPGTLSGSRNDSASQRALDALCETAPSGAWQREIATRACSSRRR
jgi:hypothetical protein